MFLIQNKVTFVVQKYTMTKKEIQYALFLNFDLRKRWENLPLDGRATFAIYVDKELKDAKAVWRMLRRKRMFQIKWIRRKIVSLTNHWDDISFEDKLKIKDFLNVQELNGEEEDVDVSRHWANNFHDTYTPSKVLTLF